MSTKTQHDWRRWMTTAALVLWVTSALGSLLVHESTGAGPWVMGLFYSAAATATVAAVILNAIPSASVAWRLGYRCGIEDARNGSALPPEWEGA